MWCSSDGRNGVLQGNISSWPSCSLGELLTKEISPCRILFTSYTEKEFFLLFACVPWVGPHAIHEFCQCSWLDQFCVSLKFPSFTTCTYVTV